MPDNVTVDNGTGTDYGVAGDKVTYSGDADQTVQLVRVVGVSGSEGSKTVDELSSANGLKVQGSEGFTLAQDSTNAALMVAPVGALLTSDGGVAPRTVLDAFGSSEAPMAVGSVVFNGTTWDRLRGDTTGTFVVGNIAHDIADAGNPIKIGGKANSTAPANVAEGDRVNAWMGLSGQQFVSLVSAGGDVVSTWAVDFDGDTGEGTAIPTKSFPAVYNGSTWDRMRGNTGGLFAQGNVAHDTVDAGNPLKIGGKAGTSINPTAVATSDRVDAHFDTKGRMGVWIASSYDGTGGVTGNTPSDAFTATAGLNTNTLNSVFNGTTWDRARSLAGLGTTDASTGIPAVGLVPHKIGYSIASITAQYTTTQTSAILGPTNAATAKPVVTSIQIQAGGTTAGTLQVYFGTGAYSRGTSRAIFDGEFAPSATLKPGYAQSPPVPYEGAGGDEIRVTTSAAINPLTVTVWYYLVTV